MYGGRTFFGTPRLAIFKPGISGKGLVGIRDWKIMISGWRDGHFISSGNWKFDIFKFGSRGSDPLLTPAPNK